MASRNIAFFLAICVIWSSSAFAQAGGTSNNSVGSANSSQPSRQNRGTTLTQPSNSPFQNPIGQGVPPAASTTNHNNSGATSVR